MSAVLRGLLSVLAFFVSFMAILAVGNHLGPVEIVGTVAVAGGLIAALMAARRRLA